jgi:hypothetical protein
MTHLRIERFTTKILGRLSAAESRLILDLLLAQIARPA